MARARFTSSISRSRPTKLVLGAGRLCPEERSGRSSRDAPVSEARVEGNSPDAISSRSRFVAVPGPNPGSLESVARSRSYCANASPSRPESA
jgi:hypothetical protein